MRLLVKKIPAGKLVKIAYELDSITSKITHFKLYGDFFLYPEYLLLSIEKNLLGVDVSSISSVIEKVLDNDDGQFIGVLPNDIQLMIEEDQK